MASPSIFSTVAPYHVIAYGTLLGSEVFQSFVGGIVAFKSLPRPAFATLQTALFPIYFSMQTVLPVVLAVTYPGHRNTLGVRDSGLNGFLEESNRYGVAIPLITIFLSGASNLLGFGPATTKVMKQRKHQETRDGKKSYDAGPHSPEMQRLNKKFGMLHGLSSLVNLAGLVATFYYGGSLARLMY